MGRRHTLLHLLVFHLSGNLRYSSSPSPYYPASPSPPNHTQRYPPLILVISLRTWAKKMALIRRLAAHGGAFVYGVQMNSIP